MKSHTQFNLDERYSKHGKEIKELVKAINDVKPEHQIQVIMSSINLNIQYITHLSEHSDKLICHQVMILELFMELTQRCLGISQNNNDKIIVVNRDIISQVNKYLVKILPQGFHKDTKLAGLDGMWQTINIATHNNNLEDLLQPLVEENNNNIPKVLIEQALPLNLLLNNYKYNKPSWKEYFKSEKSNKYIADMLLKSIKTVYKICPDNPFIQNNLELKELLIENSISIKNKTLTFKDIVVFLAINNTILASFDPKKLESKALISVYESIISQLDDNTVVNFKNEAIYKIANLQQGDFEKQLSKTNQDSNSNSNNALLMWTRLFVKSMNEGNLEVFGEILDFSISTETNSILYQRADDDEWCIVESISPYLEQKSVNANVPIIAYITQQYNKLINDLKENNTDKSCYNQNVTIMHNITQPPVLNIEEDEYDMFFFSEGNISYDSTFFLSMNESSGINKQTDNLDGNILGDLEPALDI